MLFFSKKEYAILSVNLKSSINSAMRSSSCESCMIVDFGGSLSLSDNLIKGVNIGFIVKGTSK
jgi:hypothetical protein